MECKHIVGFDEGYGNESEPEEYEKPKLIHAGDVAVPSVKFGLCPLCGTMIVWDGDRISVFAKRI